MSNTGKYNTVHGWASHGKGQPLEKFSYEAAPLQDNDIEIKISHCGICSTDLSTLNSGWGPTDYPVIVGHEIIGEVTAVGNQANDFKVGDRVGVSAQCEACLKPDCFACKRQREVHCPKYVLTFNSKRHIDGSKTYGGFAEAVRVQKDFAFKIPESIPSDYAAPLFCAGITVFTPMLQHGFKQGDKVGVIGIGGLGHLAIQFASALGCEVYALSHSHSKEKDALKMGAKHFIAYGNEAEANKVKDTLKYLIVTSSDENSQWDQFANWMDLDGKIILLTRPETDIKFDSIILLSKNLSFTSSALGSPNEFRKMLDFAGKHKVLPWIEKFPMDKCNQGVQLVRDGKVRYRVVLYN